jgi:hypothetical protein
MGETWISSETDGALRCAAVVADVEAVVGAEVGVRVLAVPRAGALPALVGASMPLANAAQSTQAA